MNKLKQIFGVKDLRNSIFFVVVMLFLFRLLAHIPIPGVDVANLEAFFQSNELLGLINVLSGGTLQQFSLVALGVAPYITASIIFQLLVMIVPKLEEIQKEGESGQQRINRWTRWLSIPLAALQAFGFITLLTQQSQFEIITNLSPLTYLIAITTMTAGSVLLMWIGELISEKNIGNGISLMIFAGIISGLPSIMQQVLFSYDSSQLFTILAVVALTILTIVVVVVITDAQRNIPISYARMSRVNKGSVDSYLPLRVNMAGVIPIIFAISVVLFPPTISQFLFSAQSPTVQSAARWVFDLFQNQLFYGIIYFVLVFLFTFFYTSVVFKPDDVAENLQKQGAFIPGIRPGKPTEQYIQYLVNRIILIGAIFLGVIAILPLIVSHYTGNQTLVVGGTSMLIVVAVVVEIVQQINAQLTMRDYEGL